MPKTIKKIKKQLKKTGKSILRNSGLTRQLKSAGISDAYIAKHDCPPLTAQEKNEIDAFWAEYGVKILGQGELTKKLTVQANAFSASAKEKIEAAGGKAEVV